MGIQGQIALLKPSRTYFSGEVIRGSVVVSNTTGEVQRLNERIFILFCGGASTNLYGKNVKNAQLALVTTNRRNSTGKEIYLHAKIFLTPEDSGGVELIPGQNGFPFEFELPFYIPSTYYGKLGFVTYKAVTSFSILGYGDGEGISQGVDFRVINSQDLNLSSIAGRNSYFSFEKLVSIKLIRTHRETTQTGLINTIVKLSHQGFVSGERIDLEIQVANQTGLLVQEVTVELIREVNYSCPAGSTIEPEVLDSRTEIDVSNGEQELTTFLIVPPNTIPSSSRQICPLILIQYFVIVNVKLQTARAAVAVGKIPIIIGTVALRQLEYVSSNNSRRGSSRRGSRRSNNSAATPLALEGAVGGEVEDPFAPSAPLVESEVEEYEDDFSEDEFPPSYSEAMTMPSVS